MDEQWFKEGNCIECVITGGNRGLGLELVRVFHENGHTVFPVVKRKESQVSLNEMYTDRCHIRRYK
jgi:NAD(P)-dependent dehydrogenase (short-subunit alcohol dehydrogenase family)